MFRRILFFSFLVLLIGSCSGTAPNSSSNSIVNKVEKAIGSGPAAQTVSINSPDGVVLVGSFFGADKPNSPALLLLHQWESDRHSWDDFAKQLQGDGFVVLAIDGRGFGESTNKTDGTTISAGRTDADVKAMLGDLGAAFEFLAKQTNVDPNRVGIVGASYGSSLALIYAVDHPNVAAIALLSPGLNYFGNMQTEPAMTNYKNRPAFLAAAKDDPDSFNAVTRLSELTGEPNRVMAVSVDKGGHGTALLKVDGVRKPLEDFLKQRFGLQGQK
jgi:pimeloyl-ACP methyl ester carboxylesterase